MTASSRATKVRAAELLHWLIVGAESAAFKDAFKQGVDFTNHSLRRVAPVRGECGAKIIEVSQLGEELDIAQFVPLRQRLVHQLEFVDEAIDIGGGLILSLIHI